MFWYCAENCNNILFLTLHFIIPWKELERGDGSPPFGNYWPDPIFPVDTIKLKLLIRSIYQHNIISSLLFTSHTFSLTVLGWLIANKHVHNEVCQHSLRNKRRPLRMERNVNNWLEEKQAAERQTGRSINPQLGQSQSFDDMTVWLLALYLGLFALLQRNTLTQASMHPMPEHICQVLGHVMFSFFRGILFHVIHFEAHLKDSSVFHSDHHLW